MLHMFFDSMMTSKMLGSTAMASIGFFAPINTLIVISYVICTGAQIMCSKYLGNGKKEKVISVFSTAFVFLTLIGILSTIICLIFSDHLSMILGAHGETKVMLSEYIRGYSIGITGQILLGLLIMFLPLNNLDCLSYFAMGVLVGTNITLNYVFVGILNLGLSGMGLSTSLSYILTVLILLFGYLKRTHTFYVQLYDLSFNILPEVIYLGLPALLFIVGCTIKAYVLNLTLVKNAGDPGVAAMNVQNMLCTLIGAIPQGVAASFLTLCSLYYGEHDKQSYIYLIRYALKLGIIMSAIAAAVLTFGSPLITDIFYHKDDPSWTETKRMLLLFPCYLILNTIFNLLMKSYHCQGNMKLINCLSFSGSIIIAVMAVVMANFWGSDAVWISFPIGNLICIIIIGIYAFAGSYNKKFIIENWIRLPEEFGYSADECLDFSVESKDDVVTVSQRVMDFCKNKNVDHKKSMISGLSIEEMVGNIFQYGIKENIHVDVRIVVKDSIILRIRDDSSAFDPNKYLEQFTPKDIIKNIGISLIANLTDEMIYRSNVGINTLLIKV